jgi:hypothetical protein
VLSTASVESDDADIPTIYQVTRGGLFRRPQRIVCCGAGFCLGPGLPDLSLGKLEGPIQKLKRFGVLDHPRLVFFVAPNFCIIILFRCETNQSVRQLLQRSIMILKFLLLLSLMLLAGVQSENIISAVSEPFAETTCFLY